MRSSHHSEGVVRMSSIADEEDRLRLEREEQLYNSQNYTVKHSWAYAEYDEGDEA